MRRERGRHSFVFLFRHRQSNTTGAQADTFTNKLLCQPIYISVSTQSHLTKSIITPDAPVSPSVCENDKQCCHLPMASG